MYTYDLLLHGQSRRRSDSPAFRGLAPSLWSSMSGVECGLAQPHSSCACGTRRYREWGARLSAPTTSGMAEQFFHAVFSHRRGLARIAELIRPHDCCDGECLVRG